MKIIDDKLIIILYIGCIIGFDEKIVPGKKDIAWTVLGKFSLIDLETFPLAYCILCTLATRWKDERLCHDGNYHEIECVWRLAGHIKGLLSTTRSLILMVILFWQIVKQYLLDNCLMIFYRILKTSSPSVGCGFSFIYTKALQISESCLIL
jgi:hypothetical protein